MLNWDEPYHSKKKFHGSSGINFYIYISHKLNNFQRILIRDSIPTNYDCQSFCLLFLKAANKSSRDLFFYTPPKFSIL